jgi:hypothetical protein
MDPKIREMVNLATADIRRLQQANTGIRAREAWRAFLEHSNRAINRLEGYSKRTNQVPKYKALLKEIWEQDLTAYVRFARNAHEHAAEDIEVDDPFNTRVAFPNGTLTGYTVFGTTAEGERVVMPSVGPAQVFSSDSSVRIVSLKPTIQLVPLMDKHGNWLMPPQIVKFEFESEPSVAAVARAYLDWVIGRVNDFD